MGEEFKQCRSAMMLGRKREKVEQKDGGEKKITRVSKGVKKKSG